MHPNEKLLRDIDAAQVRQDMEGFFAGHTDDVVIHIGGKSTLAGVYKGKDQFQELFGKFMEKTPDYTFESHAYFADDEHGIILQRSHWARGNERLTSNDTFVCHFRDGKVSELWIMSDDQYAVRSEERRVGKECRL